MKKKFMYIIIGAVALLFAGCKGNDQETNFIPTLPPSYTPDDFDIPDDIIDDDMDEPDDTVENSDDDPVYVGETTTKYVKLSNYGAILNVRSAPTTEENNVVGFLVHTEPVEVVSIEDDWAKFLYNDEVRYVKAEYLVDFVPPYISPPTLTTEGN